MDNFTFNKYVKSYQYQFSFSTMNDLKNHNYSTLRAQKKYILKVNVPKYSRNLFQKNKTKHNRSETYAKIQPKSEHIKHRSHYATFMYCICIVLYLNTFSVERQYNRPRMSKDQPRIIAPLCSHPFIRTHSTLANILRNHRLNPNL